MNRFVYVPCKILVRKILKPKYCCTCIWHWSKSNIEKDKTRGFPIKHAPNERRGTFTVSSQNVKLQDDRRILFMHLLYVKEQHPCRPVKFAQWPAACWKLLFFLFETFCFRKSAQNTTTINPSNLSYFSVTRHPHLHPPLFLFSKWLWRRASSTLAVFVTYLHIIHTQNHHRNMQRNYLITQS